MKKSYVYQLGAGLFLSAMFLVSGCGKPAVSVTVAQKAAVPFVYEADVRPDALHTLPVIPQVSGKIVSELPDVGTAVAAGQLLFQIDASQYEAQAADIQSRIAAASAASVQQVYQPDPVDDSMEASLLQQGIITRAEYDRLRGKKSGGTYVQQTVPGSGEVDPAQIAAFQAVQKAIADCTVTAPIDGIISQVYVSDNKVAAAGQPVLVIRQDSPVTADVQIPAVLDQVLADAKDTKTLTVTISDKDHINTWYGELKPQPNKGGDAYTVYKVQADNPDGAIVIGDVYRLHIDSGKTVSGYVIPSSAFVKPDQVEVVNANNLVDMRTVTVASDLGDNKLVVGGLSDGDRVINAPDGNIQLGMEVTVK